MIDAIGARAARRYFMTAEHFSAQTAKHIGLISEVIGAENLDEQVGLLIDVLLANGPEAVITSKQLVADINGQSIGPDLIEHTCKMIAKIRVSEQGQEGLQAFLAKRKPHWLED